MRKDLEAAESEESTKATIASKAQLYALPYLVAFAVCAAATWLPQWARWIPSLAVSLCLATAFSMAGALNTLARANRFYGWRDGVLRNHRAMNLIALLLLTYALLAVVGRWPLPAVAVLVAALINFAHHQGYRAALSRV